MGTTLVTGASGFVGSHLVAEMAHRGLPVRGVSRQAKPGLITIPSYAPDVDWQDFLADVDAVVHLAARVHVMRETALHPLAVFRESNVDATLNLAKQAAKAGVKRFIFVSSIKVNGERTEPGKPFSSADSPKPQDAYGLSKAEAEAGLWALGRDAEMEMEIVIIRPPLVYGPGVGGNFCSLMKWASKGLPSPFSANQNKRSFVYVQNLCDLLITALHHPNAANDTFLVSDEQDLSTHELLRELTIALGRTFKQVPVPPALLKVLGRVTGRQQAVDRLMSNLQVDASPTFRALSWAPPHTALVGLDATAKAFAARHTPDL